MAGPYTSVVEVNHTDDIFPLENSRNGNVFAKRLQAFLRGVVLGSYRGASLVVRGHAAKASGTVTFATSSGPVGATINGVTITVTWATSDTLSAAAFAAAVNASANALIAGIVTASSVAGVTTITAVQPGKTGNAITLALSGTNVTVSGARLTGGAMDTATTYLTV